MTSTSSRLLAATLLALMFLVPARCVAQQGPKLPVNPFIPQDFSNPEKMFEQMFGKSTPEEERLLSEIKISVKDEREFGQDVVDAFLADLKQQKLNAVRQGSEVEYLRKLVDTVRPFMKNAKRYPKMTIYFVDSPRTDARSCPGGTLFFYKGLLTSAESEAALVGIVGHELSHLDQGHLLIPLKRSRMLQQSPVAVGTGFDPRKFFSTGTTMMRMFARPFRPEDEAEADRDGAAWAYRAGYDPREMAQLFARLHAKVKDQKVPFGSFFRTHPYNEDRFDAIMQQYDELQATDPQQKLYRGKKNLAQRIPKSQKEFPE